MHLSTVYFSEAFTLENSYRVHTLCKQIDRLTEFEIKNLMKNAKKNHVFSNLNVSSFPFIRHV